MIYKCVRRAHSSSKPLRELFRPVIGLEVHVQLATKTKLFSRSPVLDDVPPNTTVLPHDMALPGTLPQLNRQCLAMAVKLGLLLGCKIPPYCRFDRKHYFYADMPAGYQITQSACPVARGGTFEFFVFDENIDAYKKQVSIRQLQLEQDSGKTIHHGNTSLVDLNRAGAPLVEVVTDADLSSALEAVCFVQQLRLLLLHHGLSNALMHKGHLRVDANVSLSRGDEEGVRTEIKNLNSIRHLHTAINFELERQHGILASGGVVINETRACDQSGRTVSMRDKEVETDYRITPEPNLPAVKITQQLISQCSSEIQEARRPLFERYIYEVGFDPRTAIHFAEDPKLTAFAESCIPYLWSGEEDKLPEGMVPISVFVAWQKDVKNLCQREGSPYPPTRLDFGEKFMHILSYLHNSRITRLTTLDLLRELIKTGLGEVKEHIEKNTLWRIVDHAKVDDILNQVIQKNEAIWAKARSGNAKSITKMRNLLVEHSNKRISVEDAEASVKRMKEA